MRDKEIPKSVLLGLGFDAKDGHKRITRGKNFYVFGGSKDTHKLLTDKVMEFNAELNKRHKTLDNVHKEEFHEIAEKIGLKKLEQKEGKK